MFQKRGVYKDYPMERLISKKIVQSLFLLFVILFFIASYFLLDVRRRIEVEGLDSILDQVVNQYEKSEENIEDYVDLFKSDYLNRAHAIDYILKDKIAQGIDEKELLRIKDMMQVESIYLVDHAGIVVYSSNPESINLNLRENEQIKKFWDLIDGKEGVQEVVQLDGKSILTGEEGVFVGIKSEMPEISMVQIGISKDAFESFISPYKIENIIRGIPTVEEESIFAVDRNTGEIVGITENNSQEIVFKENETKQEFVERLEKQNSNFTVKVNGKLKHMHVVRVGDYLFGAYIDTRVVYQQSIKEILVLVVMLICIEVGIYIQIRKIIQRYVLQDVSNIDTNIESLISGKSDIQFENAHSIEMKNLMEILNTWRDSYQHKSERMTQLMDKIDVNVAVFECDSTVKRVFYSENLLKILSIEEEEREQLRNDSKQFEEYIHSLLTKKDENGIIDIKGRFVSIKCFKDGEEFYGTVFDRTQEIEKINKMQERLLQVENEAYKDELTGLFNRRAVEEYIKESLYLNVSCGVMMIFDLDNFKAVNDNEGHQAGDQVLITFAECLKSSFRLEDIVARFGGDEFVVFIRRNMTDAQIQLICERTLNIIRNKFSDIYQKYHVSTSVGVACASGETNTYELLYKSADVGLYMAKGRGKDTYYINRENIKYMNGEYTSNRDK